MAAVSAKKTLVWAAVLLALAAFYYLYKIEGDKQRQEATRQQELLLHFAADDVTEVTVQRPTETITAVKREGRWQLTVPFSTPGDGPKYQALVRHLATLRYQRLVEERPESLAPFGLEAPSVALHIRVDAQTPPRVLHLGEKSPTGKGYYVHVAGQPAVYLISTTARDALDPSLYDLRDKTVMAFDPADVQEVHLGFATHPPVILQRQDHGWQLTAPVTANADVQQIQMLLQRLRDVKVDAFVAEAPAALDTYGLHTPVLRLELIIGPERTRHTLHLGARDKEGKGVYARRDEAANVFLLPQSFWDNLPKTPTALRDKTLLHYAREQITRLEFSAAADHTVITRTDRGHYTIDTPISADADQEAMHRLLEELQGLKAKDFVIEIPDDLATYGFAPPRLQITLWEQVADKAQDVRQHTLYFGNEAIEQQGVYVRVAGRPTVYLVDRLAAQRLIETTAVDLRHKKILAFDPKTIQKVRVQYPASAFTLERQGAAWRLSDPQKQAIRQGWKVDDMLYELSRLEFATLVAETAEEPSRYGLDAPQLQVTLWHSDGTPVGPLSIGKSSQTASAENVLVFAQAGGPHAPLYALKADFFNHVPKTVADLTGE
jgi:hypothetical protein